MLGDIVKHAKVDLAFETQQVGWLAG